MFHRLAVTPPDPLYQVSGRFALDRRAARMDLGVGVYRDHKGRASIMTAVRAAEFRIAQTQASKSYVPLAGDPAFLSALTSLVVGDDSAALAANRIVAVQATGGTGALRLAAALTAASRSDARLLLGTPSWPNHAGVFAAEGIESVLHSYWQPGATHPDVEAICAAAEASREGDVFVLHGACHNPTGVDLTRTERQGLSERLARRGAIALVDTAYYGLGDGLDTDIEIVRDVLDTAERALVAVSCSKSFGLYRERVGALFVLCADAAEAALVRGMLGRLSRMMVSTPPAHGAEVTAIILGDPELRASWHAELGDMRSRLQGLRSVLAAAGLAALKPLRDQRGIFAMLPLNPDQVHQLERDHAVYLPSSGRANLAGLRDLDIEPFVSALSSVGVR